MQSTKTLPLFLLFPLVIVLISCDPWQAMEEAYNNTFEILNLEEFIEKYEDKENLEPKENYTFTCERIDMSSYNKDVLFTIKMSRKENKTTYEIKNNNGKWEKITEEEFRKKFPKEKRFESITEIYEFFIDYCKRIQKGGGEILGFGDTDVEEPEKCYFEADVYIRKSYNCPAQITIQSYLEKIHIDDYFDNLFADGYRINIYDFELL